MVPETYKDHKRVANLNGGSLILNSIPDSLIITGGTVRGKTSYTEKRRSRRPYSERVVGKQEVIRLFPVARYWKSIRETACGRHTTSFHGGDRRRYLDVSSQPFDIEVAMRPLVDEVRKVL